MPLARAIAAWADGASAATARPSALNDMEATTTVTTTAGMRSHGTCRS